MKWNGLANMPVVAEYTSTNLTDWTGPTVLVQGTNAANFYECPDVFKTANGTYLVYSEINNSDRDAVYTIRLNLANQKIYFNKDGSNSVQEINQVPMPRSDDGVYRIRIYNDQSVCVMYVNDHVAFTNRIYGMPNNPWRMACEHGSVTVNGLTVKN